MDHTFSFLEQPSFLRSSAPATAESPLPPPPPRPAQNSAPSRNSSSPHPRLPLLSPQDSSIPPLTTSHPLYSSHQHFPQQQQQQQQQQQRQHHHHHQLLQLQQQQHQQHQQEKQQQQHQQQQKHRQKPRQPHHMLHPAASPPPHSPFSSLNTDPNTVSASFLPVASRGASQQSVSFQMRPSAHLAHPTFPPPLPPPPPRSFAISQSSPLLAPNLSSNAMLHGNMREDAPRPTLAHFVNSPSNNALNSAYRWEPSSSLALASSTLPSNAAHQSIIPLRLVPEPRPSTASGATTFNASNTHSHSFVHALNPGMTALAPSFNHNMVAPIVNPNSLSTATPHDHNLASSVDITKHANGHHTLKKPRGELYHKRVSQSERSSSHGDKRSFSAPLTSPVSTITTPNVKSPLAPAPQSVEAPLNRNGEHALDAHNKVLPHGTEDASTPLTPSFAAPTGSAVTLMMPHSEAMKAAPAARAPQDAPQDAPSQPPLSKAKAPSSSAGHSWVAKRPKSSRGRSRRKASNGPTIPVHLRNPKKGRARVFRECKHCRTENHIRRSDCVSCRKALPPGKRRRDGNIALERRETQASIGESDAAGNSQPLSGALTNKTLETKMAVNK